MAKGDKLLWPEVMPARFAEGTLAAMREVKLPDESCAGFIREAVDLLIAKRKREMKLAAKRGAARSRERAKEKEDEGR